jgi:hypothetical protein
MRALFIKLDHLCLAGPNECALEKDQIGNWLLAKVSKLEAVNK